MCVSGVQESLEAAVDEDLSVAAAVYVQAQRELIQQYCPRYLSM